MGAPRSASVARLTDVRRGTDPADLSPFREASTLGGDMRRSALLVALVMLAAAACTPVGSQPTPTTVPEVNGLREGVATLVATPTPVAILVAAPGRAEARRVPRQCRDVALRPPTVPMGWEQSAGSGSKSQGAYNGEAGSLAPQGIRPLTVFGPGRAGRSHGAGRHRGTEASRTTKLHLMEGTGRNEFVPGAPIRRGRPAPPAGGQRRDRARVPGQGTKETCRRLNRLSINPTIGKKRSVQLQPVRPQRDSRRWTPTACAFPPDAWPDHIYDTRRTGQFMRRS